jgi:hypothetical protein
MVAAIKKKQAESDYSALAADANTLADSYNQALQKQLLMPVRRYAV